MATTACFNAVVIEFLDDLSSTYDEHQCLQVIYASAKKMVEDNNSTPLPACAFHSLVGGIDVEGDERGISTVLGVVQNMATSLGLDVDVGRDYDSSDKATKEAICNYMKKLQAMSSSLVGAGSIETVRLDSVESILASVSEMDPTVAEAMTQSIMCIVPPGLKEFVDDRVVDCQRQIESGEMSPIDIMDQIKCSMSQFS